MKKPDILQSLEREAARKSNLDADKDLLIRVVSEHGATRKR